MPDTLPPPGSDKPGQDNQRISLLDPHNWLWLVVLFSLWYFYSDQTRSTAETIAYSQFKAAVRESHVKSITFRGDQILGTYTEGSDPPRFVAVVPAVPDDDLLPLLEEKGVTIAAESSQQPRWLQLLLGLLPWLLIGGFFIYSTRVMQQRMGGAGGLFSFGKSRAKRYEHTASAVTYDDVAGLDSAKQDLQEIIDFLRNPDRFRKLGARMPRGILLMGPPGTGKTLLAKATANEAGVPFFSVSGSEFIEMYVGVGASRVRDMFAEARANAPALIFIDEIDSVGRVRGTGVGGGHDEREQTLNQILAEMDGFSREEAVVVLAATNRPDVLDPALLRPGRFDRKVTLELPQSHAREEILKVHLREVPLADDVRIDELVGKTVGFSGADLANLVNEAALLAAREDKERVTREHFSKAHDKIVMGSERPDLLNPSERRRTATHESGHALIAYLLPESDPLHQVSIIPRGRALGATQQLPAEDRHNYPQSYLETRLAVMLGGRAAERVVLDSVSSGAVDDLEQATRIARMMITQWGMSDEIGPVHYKVGTEHPFLGYELTQERDFSEATAARIDSEVRRIIEQAQDLATRTLRENRAALGRVIESLIEKETLTREDIDALVGTDPTPEPAEG
ncbi:MAG: ATP-dependent zinc metalloprotease FtsH [Pseudomonadales bacterium]|nr:ATP-dependent zinc metalloprotease FtsH [Pseudomonadales bacterium]